MELFATTSSSDGDSIRIWDARTGAELWHRKDGPAFPRTLGIVGDDVLVSAAPNKNEIHFWSLSGTASIPNQGRCSAVEKIECLAASSDGVYCAGGSASGKIYLWDTASGVMLRYWDGHYSAVSALGFTDNNLCLISAERHAYIRAWRLSDVLDVSQCARAAQPVAFRVWTEHTLPVTDLCIGVGGLACRVVSASLDQTVKIWCLGSGNLAATIVFPSKCMAVVTDPAERDLYVGGSDGAIYPVSLSAKPTSHWDDKRADLSSPALRGHRKSITVLQTSSDGRLLLSASADGTVKVWDVDSGTIMRTFDKHRGHDAQAQVTNLCPLGLKASSSWHLHTRLVASIPASGKRKHRRQVVKPFLKDVQIQPQMYSAQMTIPDSDNVVSCPDSRWGNDWFDSLPDDWPNTSGRRYVTCISGQAHGAALKRFKIHTGRGWHAAATSDAIMADKTKLTQQLHKRETERCAADLNQHSPFTKMSASPSHPAETNGNISQRSYSNFVRMKLLKV